MTSEEVKLLTEIRDSLNRVEHRSVHLVQDTVTFDNEQGRAIVRTLMRLHRQGRLRYRDPV